MQEVTPNEMSAERGMLKEKVKGEEAWGVFPLYHSYRYTHSKLYLRNLDVLIICLLLRAYF